MNEETIVAVYDTAAHAEAAVRALEEAGVPSADITHHAGEQGLATDVGGMSPRREEPGFWARLFGTETEDYRRDSMVYDRTVQTGGSVVSVRVADVGRDADKIMQILESHNPVDIEERANSFERSATVYDTGAGAGAATGAAVAGTTRGVTERETLARETISNDAGRPATTRIDDDRLMADRLETNRLETDRLETDRLAARDTRRVEGDQVIPLAEEQLQVGKRIVNRGTTRIRRYVVETPVEQEVRLREEHVSVERRPASDATVSPDAFTDKSIELTETTEEAVVGKSAHVAEEVVVHKEGGERVETVRDTVRREEIDVDRDTGLTRDTERTTAPRDPSGKRPSGI